MYAIIEDNGKQYKVRDGDILRIDRPYDEAEKNVTFDRVLFLGGDSPRIGTPALDGVTVTADVVQQVKGEKLTIQKYRRRKGYHLKQGHRQKYTQIKITGINA